MMISNLCGEDVECYENVMDMNVKDKRFGRHLTRQTMRFVCAAQRRVVTQMVTDARALLQERTVRDWKMWTTNKLRAVVVLLLGSAQRPIEENTVRFKEDFVDGYLKHRLGISQTDNKDVVNPVSFTTFVISKAIGMVNRNKRSVEYDALRIDPFIPNTYPKIVFRFE